MHAEEHVRRPFPVETEEGDDQADEQHGIDEQERATYTSDQSLGFSTGRNPISISAATVRICVG